MAVLYLRILVGRHWEAREAHLVKGINQKKHKRSCKGLFIWEFKFKSDLDHTKKCDSGGHCIFTSQVSV